ncbi:malate dehydrogenase (oxaloacetate-decarboxylating) [Oceanotoga teriensis]|uniref:Malate dehydrogenase (Oxaloacetate-decarboxylating) n=1 Tax=Oceanotoga teriensis TaxID=515440 RepID=A0AA45HIQ3_9BACT|nr:NADP-dependent malic enzyme [Oceanotoga teriensis]PWJ95151.1 malate dehydrogenase (oxaloacetate-decarboxylating) [Oceanotoga teriensis]
MNLSEESLIFHEKFHGKFEIVSKIAIKNSHDLAITYTPGVSEPCIKIAKNPELAYKYTVKNNLVAVVTDGSAVLGLGNIGPEAALPVMEGKCILFKEFGGVDAIPICLDTQDTEEIIKTIKYISPVFGGINLEDISAPRCFEIEERLKKELGIPVFHDDQHGTAIVVLAALINSLKLVNKSKDDIRVVVNGGGSAGIAIVKLLLFYGIKDIILCDLKGIISKKKKNINVFQDEIAKIINPNYIEGDLFDALNGSDVFIGVSAPNVLSGDMIKVMNSDPIIFALANPVPEIMPNIALEYGAKIVGTGRSDFPNQINNVLAFPGIFRGAIKAKIQIDDFIKVASAEIIASMVEDKDLNEFNILPKAFDKRVSERIANKILSLKTGE